MGNDGAVILISVDVRIANVFQIKHNDCRQRRNNTQGIDQNK